VPPDSTEYLAQLVSRIAKGDHDAFLALYDQTSPKIYGLALKMMGDPSLAEEVVQEAFMNLWRRGRTFQPGRGSFMSWMLTVTRNVALDRLRRSTRRPQLADPPDADVGWEPFLEDPGSQSDEARWGTLYFAVLDLPEEQQAVITCAYYQGMSHSQIADYLGVPLGTVKTRLRLAMEKLRRVWLDSPGGPHSGGSEAGEADV
jgi:RNA polymerase sigma-70 factor (ECF subfamily)